MAPTNVEILSVNGFIEWSANIFGSFGADFVLLFFFFYCWLAFVYFSYLFSVRRKGKLFPTVLDLFLVSAERPFLLR